MHRYIAFAWNSQSAEKTFLAKTLIRRLKSTMPEWQCALATEGFHVFHVGERALSSRVYQLDQDAGVVLGKLFKRCNDTDCNDVDPDLDDVSFNRQETRRVQQTEGRHLTEYYWGRYVALLRGDDGVRLRVLRDPTGAMPCLLSRFRGINLIYSHIDDCAALRLVSGTINWAHLVAFQWFDRFVTNQTGIDGVRQIQAGECVAIGMDSTTAEFYWSPDRICESRNVDDHEQAMHELPAVIQHCVSAWASGYDRILHELSGGLDSAVVLACLSRSSSAANVMCENYFTQSPQGDERIFARKAANRAGVELIESLLHAPTGSLERMFDTRKLATPTMATLVPEYQLAREKMVKSRGIEVVFSGQGGDHFFQKTSTRLIAAEYARRKGFRRDILNVISDTSRFTNKSVWSVIAAATTYGLLRRQRDPYDYFVETPPLVSEASWNALDISNFRHPWVDQAKRLPCTKRFQIFNLIDTQNFFYLRSPCPDRVHPLISQPIIELCLQIPSYVLTYGGIDRALVRDAFTGIVPPEIIGRTVKGATTSYVNDLLVGNLPFLREYLLDGLLVREGVLARKKTEAALTEAGLVRNPKLIFALLPAMMAEAWSRPWHSDSRRAAV